MPVVLRDTHVRTSESDTQYNHREGWYESGQIPYAFVIQFPTCKSMSGAPIMADTEVPFVQTSTVSTIMKNEVHRR